MRFSWILLLIIKITLRSQNFQQLRALKKSKLSSPTFHKDGSAFTKIKQLAMNSNTVSSKSSPIPHHLPRIMVSTISYFVTAHTEKVQARIPYNSGASNGDINRLLPKLFQTKLISLNRIEATLSALWFFELSMCCTCFSTQGKTDAFASCSMMKRLWNDAIEELSDNFTGVLTSHQLSAYFLHELNLRRAMIPTRDNERRADLRDN